MMIQPAIIGLGTAVPPYCYDQMEICEKLSPALNNRRADVVFKMTEIETRYSVLNTPSWLVPNPSNEERHQQYITHAPTIGKQAIEKALAEANLSPADIDYFLVASCTGVDTPGLDVILAGELDMSPYLRRSAIVGMGCHALMPSLHQAHTTILANPQAKVLVLTVELCTLHFQKDRSIRNVLGSALFADGASAVVVVNGEGQGVRLLDTLTYNNYHNQEDMTFHPGNNGYKIYLSNRIPDILRSTVPTLLDKLLSPRQLQMTDIKHWVVHPGGAKILDDLEQVLELDDDKLQYARAILREHGNISSATLLFVLERLRREANPQAGDYGLLLGFGPGLTIELGLIQW